MFAIGVWWIGIRLMRLKSGHSLPEPKATDPALILAVGYSFVLLITGVGSAGWALVPRLESRPTLTVEAAPPTRALTNIHVLMLDGYPRSDTLMQAFGLDNSEFINSLASLGFTVAERAESNYNKTWLTMASMLSAQYVHDLPEIVAPPDGIPAQIRLSEELVNEGAVLDLLRAKGYEVLTIPSSVPSTDVTSDATVRQVGNLNSLEIALATSSLPSRLFPSKMLDVLGSDAASRIDAQLARLSDIATTSHDSPRIVLTHLMSPHPPFVLNQRMDYLDSCFPQCKLWETTVNQTGMTETEYASRMRTQIIELNRRIESVLSTIVQADPDATIIVLSDHGARHFTDGTEEHFRIFFAARPGALRVEFPDDIAPVNVFRRILSSALEVPLPDLPYEAWESDWFVPLSLTRYR
jgi:hypothetical protein